LHTIKCKKLTDQRTSYSEFVGFLIRHWTEYQFKCLTINAKCSWIIDWSKIVMLKFGQFVNDGKTNLALKPLSQSVWN